MYLPKECRAAVTRLSALPSHAITLRALSAHDYEWVWQAYWTQWGQYEDESPSVSQYWASQIFEKNTFGHVAMLDQELVGLALGHIEGHEKLALPTTWVSSSAHRALAHAQSPHTLKVLDVISEANAWLRQQARDDGHVFEAELDFLWVHPKARGYGLVKKLLAQTRETILKANVRSYALFTDNYCDCHFYQRAPWLAMGQKSWPVLPKLGDLKGVSYMFALRL